MGKNSAIEWTHHTFNPWWGCTKVSDACKFCYAEAWSRRVGEEVWGPRAARRTFGARHWDAPLTWNRTAHDAGVRHRVFCASMADVFEDRQDLSPWRARLWELIEATPHLDWLLLTKRPEAASPMLPWPRLPDHLWIGTTVESPRWAAPRLDALCAIDASVRFVSCEPLLAALHLDPWIRQLHWIIAGGESGGSSRPSHPNWFRCLRDISIDHAVPFLFKQWGNWSPATVREPGREIVFPDGTLARMRRSSKKSAGRLLDGRTWDQVPLPEKASHVA